MWTPDNRVDSVTMGGTTAMDYDYTGIRIKKSGPLGLTIYPFSGYEIGPDGTRTKYFKVGNEMLAAKQTPTADPEKKLFYHNDHLGGVNVITDLSGNRVQLTEYDPWGKVSRSEGNVEPERRFTGQILDPESGLYYYGGRYYDSELARFISPDPFIQAPDFPQNLNRYSYVLNNPVLLVDPTGHFFLLDDIILGAIIGGVLGSVTAAIIDQTPANVGFGFLTGAISGGFFGAAGGIIENAAGLSGLSKVLIHTAAGMMSGAINAAITGSNVGMGAVTGGISAGIGNVFGQFLPDKFIYQLLGRTLAGGLSGGITAEISGRDFGNGFIFGAQMAAIAYLANDVVHEALNAAANASAGFGDTITSLFGTFNKSLTGLARDYFDEKYNNGVPSADTGSRAYTVGQVTAWAVGLTIAGAYTMETAGGSLAGNWITNNVFRWGVTGTWAGGQGSHFHLGPATQHHLPYEFKTWFYHSRAIVSRWLWSK